MTRPQMPYDGKDDAETILERILRRRNWTVGVRDDLAGALVSVANAGRSPENGRALTRPSKK